MSVEEDIVEGTARQELKACAIGEKHSKAATVRLRNDVILWMLLCVQVVLVEVWLCE